MKDILIQVAFATPYLMCSPLIQILLYLFEVGVATMLLTNCAHIVQVDAKEKTPIVNYFMIR